jgi:exopolysaccharide biosynthesis polyprenyl glycosylphosphotransferase
VDGVRYPVLGHAGSVAQVAGELGADTIVVASKPESAPDFIKHLSWQLEGTAAELVLSSRLTDVAGPRISLRQVEGLPLIRVRIPDYEGSAHLAKRALDIAVSGLAVVAIALITPVIALAIKLDDGGPVFFRQTRIGKDGTEFGMLKFRTMCTDAEAKLAALKTQDEGNGVMFKMKHDPRVTRVGAFLRKTSLDELPQFWNVLRGDMSVVGPRPPLPVEVATYDGTVARRLYIKPGITGLWQISGRSDLSWDDSIRLDLRYVENWSLISDLQIMFRTGRAMIQPKGAY